MCTRAISSSGGRNGGSCNGQDDGKANPFISMTDIEVAIRLVGGATTSEALSQPLKKTPADLLAAEVQVRVSSTKTYRREGRKHTLTIRVAPELPMSELVGHIGNRPPSLPTAAVLVGRFIWPSCFANQR